MVTFKKGLGCFCFQLFLLHANADELDSLKNLARSKSHDSVIAEANIQLAVLYWDISPDSAIRYSNQAIRYAASSGNVAKQASAYKTLGVSYDYQGNMDSCLKYLQLGLTFYEKLNRIDKVSHVYNDIAVAWNSRGNYELALRNHLKALELRKEFGNAQYISMSYNNIGLIYRAKNDFAKALAFYHKSLQLKRKLNDEQGILNTTINLGSVYNSMGKYDSAYLFSKDAFERATSLKKHNDQLAAKGNMAAALCGIKRYPDALKLLSGMEEEIGHGGDKKILITVYKTYGTIYQETGVYHSAQAYFEKGLAYSEQIDRLESKMAFSERLSTVYALQGNYPKAYSYLIKSKTYREALFNEENIRQANELSAVYENQEKESKISTLSLQNEASELRNKWLLLTAVLLSILVFLIWNSLRSNRRKNSLLKEQNSTIQRALKEKDFLMKEIHHRVKNNLQIISSLLSLQRNYISDEQALEAVNDSRNRVQSMSLIHQSLYTDSDMASAEVKNYIEKLSENLFHSYSIHDNRISLELDIESFRMDVDTIVPLGLIMNELITNCLKYAFPDNRMGCIRIQLKRDPSGHVKLSVYDNGVGLDIREFDKQNSFGHKMIHAFLIKLEGSIQVRVEDGTKVDILFPYQHPIQ